MFVCVFVCVLVCVLCVSKIHHYIYICVFVCVFVCVCVYVSHAPAERASHIRGAVKKSEPPPPPEAGDDRSKIGPPITLFWGVIPGITILLMYRCMCI